MPANDYYGLPTRSLSSPYLHLEYLAEAGPRIVRLFLSGSSTNLLAETPSYGWDGPYGHLSLYGGHRLVHAPETALRSSVPDDRGLQAEQPGEGNCRLSWLEPHTLIHKALEIRLHSDRPALTLTHQLTNQGLWPVELAPWAITQLPLGGWVILPQDVRPLDPDGKQPNRWLIYWPYTQLGDSRLHLRQDILLFQANIVPGEYKIGYYNRAGWSGYLREGVFFCKRFAIHPPAILPDHGCNVEMYCNDEFLELESLAPLRTLEPGQTAEHVEEWQLYDAHQAPHPLEDPQAFIAQVFGE